MDPTLQTNQQNPQSTLSPAPTSNSTESQLREKFAKIADLPVRVDKKEEKIADSTGNNAAPENKTSLDNKDAKATESKTSANNLLDAIEEAEKRDPNEWDWGNGVKGEGPKPDWLRKEFKSSEDQAKAYNALVKKFGSFEGAPEDYDFSTVRNPDLNIHEDGDNAKAFAKMGKEMGLSQDGFNKILHFFNTKVAPSFKGEANRPVDSAVEIAKLGDGGREQIRVLDTWLKNNIPEHYGQFKQMMRTAQDIKAFLAIRQAAIGGMGDHASASTHQSVVRSHEEVREGLRLEMIQAKKEGNRAKEEQLFNKYMSVLGKK
jgi:hypothetical protein